jgi:hypothetical protein
MLAYREAAGKKMSGEGGLGWPEMTESLVKAGSETENWRLRIESKRCAGRNVRAINIYIERAKPFYLLKISSMAHRNENMGRKRDVSEGSAAAVRHRRNGSDIERKRKEMWRSSLSIHQWRRNGVCISSVVSPGDRTALNKRK